MKMENGYTRVELEHPDDKVIWVDDKVTGKTSCMPVPEWTQAEDVYKSALVIFGLRHWVR